MRKMISFKIENLPDKQRKIVDDWANGQMNIQQSLANIIMHVVEFTGNDDVMDFDIQRKLHNIFSDNGIVSTSKEDQHRVEAKQKPQSNKSDELPSASALFED